MPTPTAVPPQAAPVAPRLPGPASVGPPLTGPTLHIVRWVDPVADPHGVHPCSRYVELYWLGILGPSTCDFSSADIVHLSGGLSADCGAHDFTADTGHDGEGPERPELDVRHLPP